MYLLLRECKRVIMYSVDEPVMTACMYECGYECPLYTLRRDTNVSSDIPAVVSLSV